MSFVVVDRKGTEVLRTEDWRLACSVAWGCDGRVHTEGRFQS